MKFQDIEITVYNGVTDTIGHRATLFNFLEHVDYDAIQELRSTTDTNRKKQIKLSLPQATISGVFSPTRSAENLVRHSGLICVDIDRKDNLHIGNFDTLIDDVLSHIEQVAYAAHSVSGYGYFLIIPLKYPRQHKAQFEMLVRLFAVSGAKVMIYTNISPLMQNLLMVSIGSRSQFDNITSISTMLMQKIRWRNSAAK